MKKPSYLIITVLVTAALVACSEDNTSQQDAKTPASQTDNNEAQAYEPV